ncbi:hypothetical protein DENSPDRAFT_147601 [Dentipellis sp. KUC8613]|nr:hypothetical protein DENSPDRAFT_147601 [Dentipellis sp. KUC8613]
MNIVEKLVAAPASLSFPCVLFLISPRSLVLSLSAARRVASTPSKPHQACHRPCHPPITHLSVRLPFPFPAADAHGRHRVLQPVSSTPPRPPRALHRTRTHHYPHSDTRHARPVIVSRAGPAPARPLQIHPRNHHDSQTPAPVYGIRVSPGPRTALAQAATPERSCPHAPPL